MRYTCACLLICMFVCSCQPVSPTTGGGGQVQRAIPYDLIQKCLTQLEPYKYTQEQLMSFSTNHPPYASRKIGAFKIIYHKPYPYPQPSRPAFSRLSFVDRTADLLLSIRFREGNKEVLGVSVTDYLGYDKTIDSPATAAAGYLRKTLAHNKPPHTDRKSVSGRLIHSGGLFVEVKNSGSHPIRFLDVPLGSFETYHFYSFTVTDSDGKKLRSMPLFAPILGEKVVTIEPGTSYRREMSLDAHVSKGTSKGPYRVQLRYQVPKIHKMVYTSKHKPPPDVNISFTTEPVTIEGF